MESAENKQRKERASQTPVAEDKLYLDLKPIAEILKNKIEVSFSWDCDHYKKPRGGGPDKDALLLGYKVLKVLVQHAPNGFPNFTNLRAVLMRLEKEFGIIGFVSDAGKSDEINRDMLNY